ncbi:hypothetical protein B0T19DRAFT_398333 [Cercophora scortea]|uniref:Nephrocystin 3-like N-terminal domain-containing protein n=1 Tax=Cercophora scortea TaxID=314031 RepID=A0AAE0IWK8_9PEZI|nr:hypothetical protein B0T19DRAFT_398333 [Cercophora scortea]
MCGKHVPNSKVYRLRDIPSHLDRQDVARLLGSFLSDDGTPADINIASLASSCDFWTRSGPEVAKTATLTFSKLPTVVAENPSATQWRLPVLGLPRPMILDENFYGLTPLNHVHSSQHEYDCIVISGLASHPMGSWQPRGKDKSFMWIRDALPDLAPSIRFILYGYDTRLAGSRSFQRVPDLAVSLINTLKSGGWALPSARPLIFFAHSLGGVVLKQTFTMLAGSGPMESSVLARTKGAILFGVPSQGMPVSDIFTMLGVQPNKDALVRDISDESQFLPQLERQVSGISYVRQMKLYWAYETQTTPSLIEVNGEYQRAGPETILVSRQSATGGRHQSDPAATIQIDANHSDIAKLTSGHHLIHVVTHKLHELMDSDQRNLAPGGLTASAEFQDSRVSSTPFLLDQMTDPTMDPQFWDVTAITNSLRAPGRDERLEQIDDRAGHSFEWVYDKPSIGLSDWLGSGNGLFWISGRPASGKSTMMKFLNNDSRTWRLLQGWQTKDHQIRANFFFHHRGAVAQKSFDGLIRSILSQVMEQAPKPFASIIQPIFQDRYRELTKELGTLQSDLIWLFERSELDPNAIPPAHITSILACEFPRKLFRQLVTSRRNSMIANFHTLDMSDDRNSDIALWNKMEGLALQLQKKIVQPDTRRTTPKLIRNQLSPIIPQHLHESSRKQIMASLMAWRDAVDLRKRLSALGKFLLPAGTNADVDADVDTDADADTREGRAQRDERYMKFRIHLESVTERHVARQAHRLALETGDWTMPMLHQALRCLIEQQDFHMDIFLFLDALDEYDGPPEIVAEFLRDLVKGSKSSPTRVKIIFSSRPWNVFLKEFGHCEGFRIHEHTENDIRELCVHNIKPDMPGAKVMLHLTGEIVQRARGVFLWARLVVHDLLALAATSVQAGVDAKELRNELLKKLEGLPLELVDYYQAILERIPPIFRWDTYCLLESVCRSKEPVYVEEVPAILMASSITDFAQLQERSRGHFVMSDEEARSQIQTLSGGLIEVVETVRSSRPIGPSKLVSRYQLQLLHQTMLEFVERPQFKIIVLGPMCHTTDENGHSFLAKYYLYRESFQVTLQLKQHASQSERTTGVSQATLFLNGSFLASRPLKDKDPSDAQALPSRILWDSPEEVLAPGMPEWLDISPIGFAVSAQLHLCIKEATDQDNRVIERAPDSFLTLILWSFAEGLYGVNDVVAMIKFLVGHGFKVDHDLKGLGKFMCWGLFRPAPGVRVSIIRRTCSTDEYETMAMAILEACEDIELSVPDFFSATNASDRRGGAGRPYQRQAKLLHFSTPKLAEYLLSQRGANPNSVDSNGQTPLEHLVWHPQTARQESSTVLPLGERYTKFSLLAEHGGVRAQFAEADGSWLQLMSKFQESGYDIAPFKRLESYRPRAPFVAQQQRPSRSEIEPAEYPPMPSSSRMQSPWVNQARPTGDNALSTVAQVASARVDAHLRA